MLGAVVMMVEVAGEAAKAMPEGGAVPSAGAELVVVEVVEEDDGRLRVVDRQELLQRIAERRAAFEAAKGSSPAPDGEASATIAFVA